MTFLLVLIQGGWMVFFGCMLIEATRDLVRVERERDALWNELHGIERPDTPERRG